MHAYMAEGLAGSCACEYASLPVTINNTLEGCTHVCGRLCRQGTPTPLILLWLIFELELARLAVGILRSIIALQHITGWTGCVQMRTRPILDKLLQQSNHLVEVVRHAFSQLFINLQQQKQQQQQ